MKIQIIGNIDQKNDFKNIFFSTFDKPASLDEYDIDVIDLSCDHIWENNADNYNSVNIVNDFNSIQKMIVKKTKAKILYIIPQNVSFKYDFSFRGNHQKSYGKSVRLKDMLNNFTKKIITNILPPTNNIMQLLYENTKTIINEHIYEAAFYFDAYDDVITWSDMSGKATTIHLDTNIKDVYLTTLDVSSNEDSLQSYIDYVFDDGSSDDKPDWLDDEIFGNDLEQRNIIKRNEGLIEEAQNKIETAKAELLQNEWYKSILYKTGNELVNVIFDILEKLLECDLSNFVDKGKEDFNIKKNQCTFIGEIKGVDKNVKSSNVSQVENHCQWYNDYLEENNIHETIKPLLIINTFRFTKPSEREPIQDTQIDLAKKYGCLIIETPTLLWIFDNFKKRNISTDQCIDIFASNTGLLVKDDFDLKT